MMSMEKNIVLIGLPGCGKTTVGQILADLLHRPFMDTDTMVEELEGRTISQLFSAHGETYFRDCESRCAQRAAEQHGVIIATGGGMVLREENMRMLRATGDVFFLDRTMEEIRRDMDATHRPLMQKGHGDDDALLRLHHQRHHLYCKYAHFVIHEETAVAAAKSILSQWKGGNL